MCVYIPFLKPPPKGWLCRSLRGQHPAHETRCLAVGKTDISPPISERICMAVMGRLPNPGTVRIRSRAASYLSERRRISRRSKKHPEITDRYKRIKSHRGHKKAIIAICRMLLTAIISLRCFSNSSIWLRHWRSFTACSGEIAPSTAAWISSTGVLQRPSPLSRLPTSVI